jgi:hypothetical protein
VEPLPGCTRCGGLTIPEAFRDVGLFSLGWHCLLCGEIVDGVILQNRTVSSIMSPINEDSADWEQESDADEPEIEVKMERLSDPTQENAAWMSVEQCRLR